MLNSKYDYLLVIFLLLWLCSFIFICDFPLIFVNCYWQFLTLNTQKHFIFIKQQSSLTFTTLWANSADDKRVIFFLILHTCPKVHNLIYIRYCVHRYILWSKSVRCCVYMSICTFSDLNQSDAGCSCPNEHFLIWISQMLFIPVQSYIFCSESVRCCVHMSKGTFTIHVEWNKNLVITVQNHSLRVTWDYKGKHIIQSCKHFLHPKIPPIQKFIQTPKCLLRKQDLAFHANCRQWRQFAWNVKACFLGNIRKINQYAECWKYCPE